MSTRRSLRPLLTILVLSACTSDNPAYVVGEVCAEGQVPCSAGTVCDPELNICTCPAGRTVCGDSCVDLSSDAANCGGCGLACPGGDGCAGGSCSSGTCPEGAVECNDRCVDPLTSTRHCGGCRDGGGQRCEGGEQCVDGVCRASECAFGATSCDGSCVDLSASAENCGRCGAGCPPDQLCAASSCVDECPAGLQRCGAGCVDLNHDPTNCGRCGETCSRDEVCAAGEDRARCREYTIAECQSCPCRDCGDERSCCLLPAPGGGVQALCVEGRCPRPY